MPIDEPTSPAPGGTPDTAGTTPAAPQTPVTPQPRAKAPAKPNPPLFRVVEVSLQPDGRLARQGQVWQADLDRARRFGRMLAANSTAQKVQVADALGTIIETIPPPPPGAPALRWSDWQTLPLPPAPPVQRKAAAKPRLAPAAPKPPPPASKPPVLPRPPAVLPVMEPENEVERTSPLQS